MTAVTVSTCQSCQWNVINLKHQQSKINVVKCSDLCALVDGRGNYYPWPFWGFYASVASTWFGLHHARLKVVVLQPTVVSRFGCFVFEFWVLRFRVLGASCFGLRFQVLHFRNYPLQSIVTQLQRIQLIPFCLTPKFPRKFMMSNKRKSFYTIKKSGKVVGRERHTL